METQRILLTGITGFIGNRLAKDLVKENYEVHALVRYHAAEDYITKPTKIDGVNYFTCNLLDHIGISQEVQKIKPEQIVHLAALSPVRLSFIQPWEYQEVNYLATVNLIHSALSLTTLNKFIFASTMETYGWQKIRKPFTEDLPLNPASPYAVSKVAAEKYIQMAGEAYDLPYLIAKPCNTFGRIHSMEFVTEYLITEMLQNKVPWLGSPDAVRDMMYIDDHVNAYKRSLKSSVSSGTFNFGNGSMISMLNLANLIKKKIGFEGEVKIGFPDGYPQRPVVDPFLSLNATKAEKTLGWKPLISIEKGLDLSISYWNKKLRE